MPTVSESCPSSPPQTLRRRRLLAGALALIGAALPLRSFARLQTAFEARSLREVFEALPGTARAERSTRIRIVTSEIAENGAVVPITVESDLPGIESIALLAPENPRPLTLSLRPGPHVALPVTFRVKLAKTQEVRVVVRAAAKDYAATRQIRVVVGGCIGT